jgi:hypothetical protein
VLYWACDGAIAVFSLGDREKQEMAMVSSYLLLWGEESRRDFLNVVDPCTKEA